MSLLLATTESSSELVRSQTVAQLVSYATSSPSAFKEAAAKLEQPMHELLEQSIRKAVGGTSPIGSVTSKPQISLRSF